MIVERNFGEAGRISAGYVKKEVGRLREFVRKRYGELTGRRRFPQLKGKTVVITDDGIATGHTFMAAVAFVRGKSPSAIVAAVPVCPAESVSVVKAKVDELVALEQPAFFMAVGEFYRDFRQLSDDDVKRYLRR